MGDGEGVNGQQGAIRSPGLIRTPQLYQEGTVSCLGLYRRNVLRLTTDVCPHYSIYKPMP